MRSRVSLPSVSIPSSGEPLSLAPALAHSEPSLLAYTRARARSLVALDAGSDALDARRPAAHLLAALAEQLVAIVRYLG